MKLNINLKKLITIGAAAALIAGTFFGCGKAATTTAKKQAAKPTKVTLSNANKKQLSDQESAIDDVANKAIQIIFTTTPQNNDEHFEQLKQLSYDAKSGFYGLDILHDDYKSGSDFLSDSEITAVTVEGMVDKKKNIHFDNGAVVEFTAYFAENSTKDSTKKNYKQNGNFNMVNVNGKWSILGINLDTESVVK